VDVGFSLQVGVSLAVGGKTTIEISCGLVRALDLIRRQVLHLLLQELVVGLEDNGVLRQDLVASLEARESGRTIFDLISSSLGLFLAGIFRHFVSWNGIKEHSLGVIDVARISIQDETLVHASWTSDASLDELVKKLIWKAHLDSVDIKIGVLLLSGLLVLLDLLLLESLDLFTDFIAKRILELLGVLDYLADSQMRNSVALSKHFGEMGLSRGWGTANENFEREESSVEVKLFIQQLHGVSGDTLAAMPLRVGDAKELHGAGHLQVQ